MEFTPNDEAVAISDAVASLVAGITDDDVDTRDSRTTTLGVEMGLRALLLPEELGGLALNPLSACGVLRELGTAPTHVDWVGQLVALPLALSAATTSSDDLRSTAERWVTGETSLEFVPVGRRSVTRTSTEAQVVELAVGPDSETLVVHPGEAWASLETHAVAGGPGLSVSVPTDQHAPARFAVPAGTGEQVQAAARTAAAAFLLGTGHAALDRAVQHSRMREQFGRPIGSFQAVKHLLAAALEGLTMAEPLVTVAAHSSTASAANAALDAALAVRQAGEAAERAVRAAIQVHGALAYTDETPLGGLLGQVRSIRAAWAPTSAVETLVAQRLLDGVEASAVHEDEEGL